MEIFRMTIPISNFEQHPFPYNDYRREAEQRFPCLELLFRAPNIDISLDLSLETALDFIF